jgi:O-succinylbenzoic acid--CoA ligase
MSLSLLAAARETPHLVALVDGLREWRFSELAPRVEFEMAALEHAYGAHAPGTPGLLTAHTSPEVVVRLYACFELGIAPWLAHPRWTAAEHRAVAATAGQPLDLDQIADNRPANRPAGMPPADDQRALAVLFTSGSSGAPKGVELSRAAFVASAQASAARLGWQPEDRWLLSLPLAHVGGLSILTRCLLARRPVVLAPSLDPTELLARIERQRVTLVSLVAAQLRRWLDASPTSEPPPALRAILLGGGPCPPTLLDEAAERGWPVLATYGLTETCSQIATQPPGWRPTAADGAGPPLSGIGVRIRDGAIQVRGPVLLSSYIPASLHSSPLSPDGWLATGDLGALDERGNLHVLGRLDDLIITGGENVAPLEVEQALSRCPGVRAALVFGVADPTWGARVAAAVVVDPRTSPSDAALRRQLALELAPFKRPRLLARVDALPMLPNGKPDRRGAAHALAAALRPLE